MTEPRDPSNKHFRLSIVKSGLRIIACIALPFSIFLVSFCLGLAAILCRYEALYY